MGVDTGSKKPWSWWFDSIPSSRFSFFLLAGEKKRKKNLTSTMSTTTAAKKETKTAPQKVTVVETMINKGLAEAAAKAKQEEAKKKKVTVKITLKAKAPAEPKPTPTAETTKGARKIVPVETPPVVAVTAVAAVPAGTLPYLILTIKDNKQASFKPFKNVLGEARGCAKDKALLYVHFMSHDGVKYHKIGHACDTSSYASKDRYAAPIPFKGLLQIHRWGKLHELFMHAYVNQKFESSEWHVEAGAKIEEIVLALRANTDNFQTETRRNFVNIVDGGWRAFTGVAGKGLNGHLSLYRVQYRGRLLKLTEDNVTKSLKDIMASQPPDE